MVDANNTQLNGIQMEEVGSTFLSYGEALPCFPLFSVQCEELYPAFTYCN